MKLQSKILISFLPVMCILLLTGSINIFFFFKINHSIDEMVEKRFVVEQKVQDGHLIINRIYNKIWDTLIMDVNQRGEQIKELDQLANSFYIIMDAISDYLPYPSGNIRDQKRFFQTYYIVGKDLLAHSDLADFKENEGKIQRFKQYKEQLVQQIDERFMGYKNEFATALSELQKFSYVIASISIFSCIIGVFAAVILSVKFASSLVRPVVSLTRAVRAFQPGKSPVRVDEGHSDEIGRLGRAFNEMTRQLNITVEKLENEIVERKDAEKKAVERREQLVQADKMASLGILVSGVAHEINNPNQFIISHITPLKQAWDGAIPVLERYYQQYGDFRMGGTNYSVFKKKMPQIFANISKGSDRIKTIVDELRGFVNEAPGNRHEPVGLNGIVDSALTLVSNMIKKTTSHFIFEKDHDLPEIPGHYQRLEQVVVNVLQNACQALSSRDDEIYVRTWFDDTCREVVLSVKDTGKGIAPEDIKHITDPFFTTKRSRGGTGLGLSISSSIIADHGGSMVFESVLGEGTLVTIRLPRVHPDIRAKEDT